MILKNKTARNGSKGITPISMVIGTIVGVGIIAFVYYGLLNRIPGLTDDIIAFADWLFGGGGGLGGIGQANTLTAAIECAYYRCTEGCAYAIAKVPKDGDFDCSEYCKAVWTDDGTLSGKICDSPRKEPPIVVSVPDSVTLSKDNLGFLPGTTYDSCIVLRDDLSDLSTYSRPTWVQFQEEGASRIETPKEECLFGLPANTGTIKKCDSDEDIETDCGTKNIGVEMDTYYVWYDGGSVVWRDDPTKKEEIEVNEMKEIAIPLQSGVSDLYRIDVKSAGSIIDKAFLRVYGLGNPSECSPIEAHPWVIFSCEEDGYRREPICAGGTLNCGEFSLTFKNYTRDPPSSGNLKEAVFYIRYAPFSKEFVCCSEDWYDGSICPSGLNTEDLLSCEPTASDNQNACEEKCLREKYKYGAFESNSLLCYCNTPITKTTSRVFVTSETYTGDLGGLIGADNKCRVLARDAGLGLDGKWRAWLSDSAKDAKDRILDLGNGYELIDGTKIADDLEDLTDGSLRNAINLNESGVVITIDRAVWTGTNEDGSKHSLYKCNDWTSSEISISAEDVGRSGNLASKSSSWTSIVDHFCDKELRLYCFEVA